jgi:hypothetical protein
MSIERSPNRNKVRVVFDDWDADMMVLSSKLHLKPDHPHEVVERNHEIGIDRLSKLPHGHEAIDALYELADDLKYRPDAQDVLRVGILVIRANYELNSLLRKRKRKGIGKQEWGRRTKSVKRLPPIRTAGPVGFTREN